MIDDSMISKIAEEITEDPDIFIEKKKNKIIFIEEKNNKTITKQLQELLSDEYLQRDMYETHSYYLFGLSFKDIQQELENHQKEEQDHINILNRYLMSMDVDPLLDRQPIPKVELTVESILNKNLELEKSAVEKYSKIISSLEDKEEFTSLRVDLENIMVQEQEHVHDIMQWMNN